MRSVCIRQIKSDANPVEVFDRIAAEKMPFFLDSALSSPRLARFSFIGCRPFLVLRSSGNRVEVIRGDETRTFDENPLHRLRKLLQEHRLVQDEAPVPFTVGAVGYFAYDLCHQIERLPKSAVSDIRLPELWIGLYDAALAYDHSTGQWWACAADFDGRAGRDARLAAKIDALVELIERPGPRWTAPERIASIAPVSNFSRDEYIQAICRTKDYIAAGDIFQANISQRFHTTLDGHPYELYRRLRETNAAPFAAYLDIGGQVVASSSPERFLKVTRDGRGVGGCVAVEKQPGDTAVRQAHRQTRRTSYYRTASINWQASSVADP